MKKLILFIGFGLFLTSQNTFAQTCAHGTKSADAKSCVKPTEAALKAAKMDASIETKVCEKSGSVCFIRKSVGADGASTSTEVKYDEATASFVNIPAGSGSGNGKSCSSSKACCAKGSASGKACCKSKGTAAVTPENMAPTQEKKSE
ncbi:MAG: hypothetical protein WAR77_02660 [Saprospiraceae bacterium]|nr:hypothetical protein [Saprospiraceae bacterium]